MLDLLHREFSLLKHNLLKAENPERPLLVCQAGIGDFILSFGLIAQIATNRPKSVDIIATPLIAPLASASPWARQVHTLATDQAPSQQLLARIREAAYTTVYSVRSSAPLFKLLIQTCRNAFFIPNPRYERARLISRALSFISHAYRLQYYEQCHISEIYSSMSRYPPPKTPLSPIIITTYSNTSPDLEGLSKQDPLTIIHVGGKDPIRRLHQSTLLQLIKPLKHPVLVGFGEEDARTADALIATLSPGSAINLVNKLSLVEVFALLNRASLCIAPDSSIMHLASCTKVPLVALMGNARPKTFGPTRSTGVQVLDLAPSCSPCSRHHCQKFQGASCVQAITAPQIIESLSKLSPDCLVHPYPRG